MWYCYWNWFFCRVFVPKWAATKPFRIWFRYWEKKAQSLVLNIHNHIGEKVKSGLREHNSYWLSNDDGVRGDYSLSLYTYPFGVRPKWLSIKRVENKNRKKNEMREWNKMNVNYFTFTPRIKDESLARKPIPLYHRPAPNSRNIFTIVSSRMVAVDDKNCHSTTGKKEEAVERADVYFISCTLESAKHTNNTNTKNER